MWCGIGLLWLVTRLPYRWLLPIGAMTGRVLHFLAPRRRRIARVNIRLCFPELDEHQQRDLVRRHFETMGIMLMETGLSWWSKPQRLCPLSQIEGLEHLEAALARGRGVMLLGAHYTTLEISGPLLSCHVRQPVDSFYRQHENPVIEYVMRRGRERHLNSIVPRDSIRDLLRSLKQNHIIWYAPDQAYQGKGSALVPFFGVAASSNTGTSRIIKMSGAALLPYHSMRLPQGGYRLRISAPLENFPSGDDIADTLRIHRIIEDNIRQCPEQYFWLHRRFKRRHAPDPYKDSGI